MKWEYKVTIKTKMLGKVDERIEEELNKLGSEGWDLVSAMPSAAGFGTTTSVLLIFKRQVG